MSRLFQVFLPPPSHMTLPYPLHHKFARVPLILTDIPAAKLRLLSTFELSEITRFTYLYAYYRVVTSIVGSGRGCGSGGFCGLTLINPSPFYLHDYKMTVNFIYN
jgi:hypothetical protein